MRRIRLNGVDVTIQLPDYINQGHTDKTNWIIERVVEFAEEQTQPFTRSQAWKACYGHYSVSCQVIHSMKRAGLLRVVNPGGRPELLIRADRE